MKRTALILALAAGIAGLAGCQAADSPSQAPSAVEQQRQSAAQQAAANQTECNECDSILFKRATLGKPGLIGYVVFLSYDGRPIQYYTVKGKCTGGGKRLENSYEQMAVDKGEYDGTELVPGPGDDGTYGTSGDYVYCRTTSDAYVQWNGQYLYSSQPFDLTIKPLVIDTSGKEQGQ
jgi:hypothetical protein